MSQFGRPEADTLIGNYSNQAGGTSSIFQAIDESSASEADYIRSPTNPANEVYVTRLSDIVDPLSSSGHVLRVRAGTDQASGGEQINMTMQLRQGYVNESSQGTLIATATQNNITPGGWTTYSMTLSGAEADAITDYTDLYLRIVMNKP